jgi:integrase
MWSFVSAVFKLAVTDSELTANPCLMDGKLYDGSRMEKIWTTPQVNSAPLCHTHQALLIGLWTGQRKGDVLRLKLSNYDAKRSA